MSEPFVFVSRPRIKEGKLDGFKQVSLETAPMLEESQPRTAFMQGYTNTEGTKVTAFVCLSRC